MECVWIGEEEAPTLKGEDSWREKPVPYREKIVGGMNNFDLISQRRPNDLLTK